jgi:hypothetical protein
MKMPVPLFNAAQRSHPAGPSLSPALSRMDPFGFALTRLRGVTTNDVGRCIEMCWALYPHDDGARRDCINRCR